MKIDPLIVPPISPSVLLAIFMLVFAACIIISLILLYHWRTYAVHGGTIARVKKIYFIGAGLLLIFQLGTIIFF